MKEMCALTNIMFSMFVHHECAIFWLGDSLQLRGIGGIQGHP
jgi:hypothetical protein